jgi:hypothetical protein
MNESFISLSSHDQYQTCSSNSGSMQTAKSDLLENKEVFISLHRVDDSPA